MMMKMQSRILVVISISCMLIVGTLSWPIPQDKSLTEEQFGRSFNDREIDNDVKIVSGYSTIARYGRGFSNEPIKNYPPIEVRSPFDLPDTAREDRQRSAKFDDDEGPVFDLQEMLEQQEIRRRIEEANRKEQEKIEMEAKKRLEEAEEAAKEAGDKLEEAGNAFEDSLNKILDEGEEEEAKIIEQIKNLEKDILANESGNVDAQEVDTEEVEATTESEVLEVEVESETTEAPLATSTAETESETEVPSTGIEDDDYIRSDDEDRLSHLDYDYAPLAGEDELPEEMNAGEVERDTTTPKSSLEELEDLVSEQLENAEEDTAENEVANPEDVSEDDHAHEDADEEEVAKQDNASTVIEEEEKASPEGDVDEEEDEKASPESADEGEHAEDDEKASPESVDEGEHAEDDEKASPESIDEGEHAEDDEKASPESVDEGEHAEEDEKASPESADDDEDEEKASPESADEGEHEDDEQKASPESTNDDEGASAEATDNDEKSNHDSDNHSNKSEPPEEIDLGFVQEV